MEDGDLFEEASTLLSKMTKQLKRKASRAILKKASLLVDKSLAKAWKYVSGFTPKIKKALHEQVGRRLVSEPPESIQSPPLKIAVPAIQSFMLADANNDKQLREMCARILIASMSFKTFPCVHPSFIHIIPEIDPDELVLLRYLSDAKREPAIEVREIYSENLWNTVLPNFSLGPERAGCLMPERRKAYFENLERLALAKIFPWSFMGPGGTDPYSELIYSPIVQHHIHAIRKRGYTESFNRKILSITDFGLHFCKICLPTSEDFKGISEPPARDSSA